jgi:hypothetical protein
MPHSFTSIATFTEAIARILEKYQVDSGDLFEQVGLSREPFRDPDARVKMSDMIRIWEEAERRTKNPCIGFEVGMGLRATNFHAVGYAWLSSATIREALNRAAGRRHSTVCDRAALPGCVLRGVFTVFGVNGSRRTTLRSAGGDVF